MRLVAASCLVHPKIALAPVQTVWGKGNDPLAAIPATKPKIQSITRAPKEVRTLRGLRDKEAEEVAPIIQTPELELQVLVMGKRLKKRFNWGRNNFRYKERNPREVGLIEI
ncbi:hypothetical protein K432DRAFT_447590 [Lepidopterella palustris CBS 459.81]|uniref:Uncharacterized protein n=1 Tax=Lepidopterella palustris CBS 459.81 TaxID=1314670 RepID=A0A8E2DY33_9PEZI|nr:hypothetical protein K432DRAFT_447590 [Lepidopterella palustris CBS 459.81]